MSHEQVTVQDIKDALREIAYALKDLNAAVAPHAEYPYIEASLNKALDIIDGIDPSKVC